MMMVCMVKQCRGFTFLVRPPTCAPAVGSVFQKNLYSLWTPKSLDSCGLSCAEREAFYLCTGVRVLMCVYTVHMCVHEQLHMGVCMR